MPIGRKTTKQALDRTLAQGYFECSASDERSPRIDELVTSENEMTLTFSDVVTFIVVFLLWLLAAFLVSHDSRNRAGNRLLALFLLSKSLCFIHGLLFRFADQLVPVWPHAYFWGISFEFVLGPSLYLYARSLVGGGIRLRERQLLHLIPFFVHVSYMALRFHRLGSAAKIDLIRTGAALGAGERIVIDTVIFLHLLVYLLAAVRLYFRHRARIKNVYSRLENKKLAWLGSLLFFFLCVWILSYVNLTWHSLHPPNPLIPWFVFDLLLLSFATMIVLFGLRQPEIFGEIGTDVDSTRESRPRLAPSDRERFLRRITVSMEKDKPYLNPNITLGDLSRYCGVPPRDLSYLLRESLNTCFYDFINRHRIEEAKRLLLDGRSRPSSVIEILQQAGFNSKSVFNTAFKRHTGLTPTEYRKARAAD
ncbi:MAG: helix-turn-helix transcriptional regulator [Vicinamibacteria bacterium]|nr:helix-turn-helix transcriptional regulator [Vicinamibacteria bacterium]